MKLALNEISKSEFNRALQVYGKNLSKRMSYDEVKEMVYSALTLYKPFPVLDKRSIVSNKVSTDFNLNLGVSEQGNEVIVLDSVDKDSIMEYIDRLRNQGSTESEPENLDDDEFESEDEDEFDSEDDEFESEDDEFESEDDEFDEDEFDEDEDEFESEDEDEFESEDEDEFDSEDEDEFEYVEDEEEFDSEDEDEFDSEDEDEFESDEDEFDEDEFDSEDEDEFDDEEEFDSEDEEEFDEDEEDFDSDEEESEDVESELDSEEDVNSLEAHRPNIEQAKSEVHLENDKKVAGIGTKIENERISFSDLSISGDNDLDFINKVINSETSKVTVEQTSNSTQEENTNKINRNDLPPNPIEYLKKHPRALESEVKDYYPPKEVDKYIARGLIQKSRGRLFI